MLSETILLQAAGVLATLRARGWRAATAESCTGGLVCAALTHVAGSSDVVDRGFVTYSNEAKTDLLGVSPALIVEHGAVSGLVAERMVLGALARSLADVAVSITGVAGPGGGSAEKPVGLVWFGCARRDSGVVTRREVFAGDRAAVREQAVGVALALLGGLAKSA
jgi:nicotinamide-nucleotide amidase